MARSLSPRPRSREVFERLSHREVPGGADVPSAQAARGSARPESSGRVRRRAVSIAMISSLGRASRAARSSRAGGDGAREADDVFRLPPAELHSADWETRRARARRAPGEDVRRLPAHSHGRPEAAHQCRAQREKANVRFTCCAQIEPTSISKGSGMSISHSRGAARPASPAPDPPWPRCEARRGPDGPRVRGASATTAARTWELSTPGTRTLMHGSSPARPGPAELGRRASPAHPHRPPNTPSPRRLTDPRPRCGTGRRCA